MLRVARGIGAAGKKEDLRELLRLREVIGSLLFMEVPYGSLQQVIRAALLLDAGAYRMVGAGDLGSK